MTATIPTDVWDLAAELGEGPVWVERDRALWFVDIKKQLVHRFDPASSERRSWAPRSRLASSFPPSAAASSPGCNLDFIISMRRTANSTLIVKVDPDIPDNRLNDGVVDPAGRLWFGTMDNGERDKSGAFYCFADGRLTRTDIDSIAITNGPAVSPDGRILYVVDTLKGTIDAADIATTDRWASGDRSFASTPTEGHPDGPTIDSEGCVWISLYAGWEARRYSPDGTLVDRVRFPVANITKIAFGGDDLRTAFATTARQMLSAEEIARQPQIGDLFEFRVDVPGVPCPLVRY